MYIDVYLFNVCTLRQSKSLAHVSYFLSPPIACVKSIHSTAR